MEYGVSRHFQQYLSYFVAVISIGGVLGENHRPATSHWPSLSHTVASSTPRLSEIRTLVGDSH